MAHALDVLDLLSRRESLRVTPLAHELGVAPSTAHRVLTTLEHRGYAVKDPHSSRYRPGAKLLLMRSRRTSADEIRESGHAVMTAVRDELGESISLSVRTGGEVQFIDGVDSLHALRAAPRIGARLPAYATAGGRVQLAELSPEDIARLYPATLPGLTEHTVTDREELLAQLGEVRRRGYAVSQQQSTSGVSALSVLVRSPQGQPMAGLTAVMPTQRYVPGRAHQVAQELQAAASQIARHLNSRS